MKLIVGHFYARPGQRQNYLDAARHHMEESRKEPGCLFFEFVPLPDHPDGMLLAEGFVSEEVHRLHESTEHMRALWAVGPDLLDRVDIHNLVASTERKQERFD